MKKNRESEDMDNRHERAQTMMPDYSKSFAVGGSKKFVNISMPGINCFQRRCWVEGEIILQKTALLLYLLSKFHDYFQTASL